MPEQPEPTVTITVHQLETALRDWLAQVDYDIHKNFECGEETGEDTYPDEAAGVFAFLQGIKAEQPTPQAVPRTERAHWVDIAGALNAAVDAGMPVGIDLDGTLTDRNAWSVVWDAPSGRWAVAGYDEDVEARPACAKCRTPFDPADPRSDGRSQYPGRPYCRICVNRCHDTEIADHRCIICAPETRQ